MEGSLFPLQNDAVVLGLLALILGFVFHTSGRTSGFWSRFYGVVPALLLCYFLPSLLNTFGLVDPEESQLYFVASRYLLPGSLVLLTLSIDLKAFLKLGPKAVIMFLTGTAGIVVGGPIAILVMSAVAPDVVGGVGPDAVWRGMATIAGSWIGGGANQTAMYEVFKPSNGLFTTMIAVDVIVANVWMAFLLYGAGRSRKFDARFKADASAIDDVKKRVEDYHLSIARMPKLGDLMAILAIAFGATGLAHFGSDLLAPWLGEQYPELDKFSLTSGFFWLVVLATTFGLVLSFTRARNYEGAGASRVGSAFLYVLVATIGMKMDVTDILDQPGLFAVGFIWMAVHAGLLIAVAYLIKAPFFFLAVGSQANVGGAASAPIVASAFHPALASVGVLLAVVGYALGTYAGWLCGILMEVAAR